MIACSQVITAPLVVGWNRQGWLTLGSGILPDTGDVYALAWGNGKLSAGGVFSFAGGKISNNFAQYLDPAMVYLTRAVK